MRRPLFAVLGAGSGGLAVAGYLARNGFAVRLWNRSPERLLPLGRLGGVTFEGQLDGLARLDEVTADLGAAVRGAQVLILVVPATAHGELARELADFLEPGQVLVLCPGRTGGALEVRRTLAAHGAREDVIVAETETLPFACRSLGDGRCRLQGIKRRVAVAALPARDTARVAEILQPALPMIHPVPDVLHTGLGNMGAVFHPGVTLLNVARIEAAEKPFEHYREGVTPAVARVVERIDGERVRVAIAYGVPVTGARAWLAETYGAEGATLRDALRANPAYAGIDAPTDSNHRYLWEDVPTGLVPLSELGRLAGLATPAMDALIVLASAVHDTDYRRNGRSAARMGLEGLTASGVRRLVREGGLEVERIALAAGQPDLGGLIG